MFEEVEGQILWQGNTRLTFIAPDEETWNKVLLVQYPSRAAFLKMVTSSEYQKIAHHRGVAPDDLRLIETQSANRRLTFKLMTNNIDINCHSICL